MLFFCYTLPQEHGVVYKPQSNQATEMFGTSNNCAKLDLGLTSITRLGFLDELLGLYADDSTIYLLVQHLG